MGAVGGPLPKVVATDLDGTLLRADGTVSAPTLAALRAADAAGIHVVFVTARPPRWLPPVADAVGRHGQVICLGGACVLDLRSGGVLESRGFADDDVRAAAEQVRRALPGVALAAERIDGAWYEPGFAHDDDRVPQDAPVRVAARLEEALGGPYPVAKLLARLGRGHPAAREPRGPGAGGHPATSAAGAGVDLHAVVAAAVGGRAHLADSGARGLAELLPVGVSKAGALHRWCARLGVEARDVWAVGDAPNDLPMLTWAGRSFAVANADPTVLAAVGRVVAANELDGVAEVLAAALGG